MGLEPVAYGLPEIPDVHWSVLLAELSELVQQYDPHNFFRAFFAAVACILVVMWLLRCLPFFKSGIKQRVTTWKEERDMRRERQGIQQKDFADSIENRIEHMLDEGDMTPGEASYWRSFFSQKLPDLRKPKDVKLGIFARFASGWYTKPMSLPDGKPLTDSPMTGKFGS